LDRRVARAFQSGNEIGQLLIECVAGHTGRGDDGTAVLLSTSLGHFARALACGFHDPVVVSLGGRARRIFLRHRSAFGQVAVPETVFSTVSESAIRSGESFTNRGAFAA